jgi:hypothetical protein
VGWGELVLPADTGEFYDLRSEWRSRQPGLYAKQVTEIPGADLDPRVPLAACPGPYASRPTGIQEGDRLADFVADQWSALSTAIGLDALHLRDGWLGPMIYRRSGYYGTEAHPDPQENKTWTTELRTICRRIKEGSPETFLMLYSSAMSSTAEWLVGCIDLEEVLSDGHVDAFVDQTWGGAWQDWWPTPMMGWTFQLENLLGHAAVIKGSNASTPHRTRHYPLIETWDGWEPWDTLHRTPEKLRWAIWAFTHAFVATPDGLQGPDGAYISWMNDPHGRLISAADTAFLVDELAAAELNAAETKHVHGVATVHNRVGLQSAAEIMPAANASAFLEENMAMLAKYATPVGPGTRSEWLAATSVDAYAIALPQADVRATLRSAKESSTPVLITGHANLIDPDALDMAGVCRVTGELHAGYVTTELVAGRPGGYDVIHLPDRAIVSAKAVTLMETMSNEPLVVASGSTVWWQPPEAASAADQGLGPTRFGSSVEVFLRVSRALNEGLRTAGRPWVHPVAAHESATVHIWSTPGQFWILAGNLETGWTGDSRWPREVTVEIPIDGSETAIKPTVLHGSATAEPGDAGWLRVHVIVPPEGMALVAVPSR